jgi:formylglycine-generating enzyme
MWPEAHHTRAPVHDWPPAWASGWGDDEFGAWAEFEIGRVAQRLRWIEPGNFQMGTEQTDVHSYSDERPQHVVTLREGFWLADTPCTQALWLEVCGGKNPSHFQGVNDWQERPVESVNIADVQGFFKKLQTHLAVDCEPVLPTEAQWEYACRAGTQTAYWWGDEFDGQRANVDEQYKGTTAVKRFEPNPWGLHDMHGNVWEWCADDQRKYGSKAQENPTGSLESDARVVRGGSWVHHAVYATLLRAWGVPRRFFRGGLGSLPQHDLRRRALALVQIHKCLRVVCSGLSQRGGGHGWWHRHQAGGEDAHGFGISARACHAHHRAVGALVSGAPDAHSAMYLKITF